MYLFKANLAFQNDFRQKPITGNPYRPLLYFSNNVIRSGLLVLEKDEVFEMDQSYSDRLIKIYFYKDLDVEKEFFVGRAFTMAEGGTAIIGQGVITEVIGEESPV